MMLEINDLKRKSHGRLMDRTSALPFSETQYFEKWLYLITPKKMAGEARREVEASKNHSD